MSTPFTIALPAGRLARESVDFFRRCTLADFDIPEKSRELIFTDPSGEFRVILVRSQDVPVYVAQGGADAGIAGRDVLAERGYDLAIPLQLNFGYCRLSLAAPLGTAKDILKTPHIRVATKYPRLTQDYLFQKGVSCEVIKLHGSIEIAPLLGLADCVTDLVSTGSTLAANGMEEGGVILESSAMLVVNRSAFALETDKLNLLLDKFQAALAAEADTRAAQTSA